LAVKYIHGFIQNLFGKFLLGNYFPYPFREIFLYLFYPFLLENITQLNQLHNILHVFQKMLNNYLLCIKFILNKICLFISIQDSKYIEIHTVRLLRLTHWGPMQKLKTAKVFGNESRIFNLLDRILCCAWVFD